MLLLAQSGCRHCRADDIHKLKRCFYLFLFAAFNYARSYSSCIALFAEIAENANKLRLIPIVYDVRRGKCACVIHAHVKRRIVHVRKAAFGLVKLR